MDRVKGIQHCKLINLPKVTDPRGNLTFIESNNHAPFDIKRIYYLYDVPGGAARGGHAHKVMQQLMIAVSGSFDVILDDGYTRERLQLNSPYYGLYLGPAVWREMANFSSGSICLVLASTYYDESDYYWDYATFLQTLKDKK